MTFNAPLGEARAASLVASLRARGPTTFLDLGCGWAELLRRCVAATPGARGTGVDRDEDELARGRALIAEHGLGDRVTPVAGDAAAWDESADVVLCVGSTHAWPDTGACLRALRRRVAPGGRVLWGEGFWDSPPTPAALAAVPEELSDLAGLVAAATAAGLRPLEVAVASAEEWDAWESASWGGLEAAALDASEPLAAPARERADVRRTAYLSGYRGVLGFAYLTLAPAR